MTETKTNYDRIQLTKETFDPIDRGLMMVSHVIKDTDHYSYYFLDRDRRDFVKFDRRNMTLDLSDVTDETVKNEVRSMIERTSQKGQ